MFVRELRRRPHSEGDARILTRRGAARKLERCVRWTIRGPVPIPHPQRAAMSFFNTLQQYVTSGVASLSISPRRFGSRENSTTSEDGTSTNSISSSGPPPLKVVQPQPQQNPLPLSPPLPPQPGSRSPALQRSPHHHHLLLQERSKSLKTGPSLQHQSRLSPRTGSLKEVPSLSITAAGPSSNGGNSSGGTSVSSVAAVSGSSSPLTLHHHQHGPLGSGTGKRREPIKVLPTFAQGDGTTRRTSWPQFAITGSGVQESDGSFFESYTALCWKQENRRLQVLREDDQQQDGQSHGNIDPGGSHRPATNTTTTGISPKEMEQLYVEVLYTIRHKLGAHSAKYPHHVKEDLVHYAQLAFGVSHEYHRKCHAIASEEKPPIVVLNVIVIEAEGLEAKDPNGFSDPYCMLGIQPGHHPQQCKIDHQQYQPSPSPPAAPPVSPLPPLDEQEQHHLGSSNNNDRRDSLISLVPIDRLKKHSSFRLSFKRKDHHGPSTSACSIPSSSAGVSVPAVNHQSGAPSPPSIAGGTAVGGNREQRDSLNGALPAKFIRATSVKNATLNPKWNEKFRFDIDDVCSDTLHLDIWDHDDEYSVLDAVSKLNEVRGVKGLGRFFKQIAQSARSGNQDDFLGCVNISLQEIPSTGVETWYKLGGRSQRSTIQGRIHLKLWLSTREDLGTSEEDNWTEIKQQENLHCIFIDFEVSRFKNGPSQWPGELSQAALTILHQHAIQGDVTVLQTHVVRWIAYARKLPDKDLHYSVLYRILNELDQHWNSEPLSREEEEALDQSFTAFVAHSLNSIRQLRFFFRHSNTSKLEYLLKCLMQLDGMRAFRRCCPFHKEIRGEIGSAVRKGALDWFNSEMARCVPHDNRPLSAHINGLTTLTNRIYADLTRAHQLYDDMFKTICSIPYFAIVHKSHMKMILHDYSNRLENIRSQFPAHSSSTSPDSGSTSTLVQDNASAVFELNIALQDLQKFQDHVQPEELPPTYHNTVALTCHECFRLVLEHWLVIARTKALNRVRSAVELDSFTNVEPYLKHSTSAIDTTSCFYQICDFWKQLAWPELTTSYPFVYSIVEMITASSIVYADLIFLRVQNTGFFNDDWKTAGLTEQIYVNINNLQHVKNALQTVPQTLQVPSIITAIDGSPSTLDIPRSPVTSRSRSGSLVSNSNHLLTSGGPLNNSSSTYDNSARQAFHALLDTVREHYEMKLLRIAGCLAEKMKGELKKNIFHLAWSPDSLPASEAATPLLDCLDNILLDLEPNLLPGAFHRCAVAIWEVLLIELWAQAEVSSGDKFCKFYDRLYGALQMLSNFLHADGKGLPMESLRCPTYQRVEEKISLHKTRTENLIDLYHLERLEQQSQLQIHGGCSAVESGRAPYGVLSIRVYFHHDSLSVEILSARDVIPLDPNGLSDPFVIIELLPRRLFPNCSEQQTSVKRKNLNPVFDECFEFPVTLEQCRQETAMLLFTVMDYDVLTANDFAGEAVLSLNTVPGVATIPQGLDTFHGLKQIDLVLMQQSNKHHPILSVLESRSWDRTAQDFVRKQKARIVSN